MGEVSTFLDFTQPENSLSLTKILGEIGNGKYKSFIDDLRNAKRVGNIDKADSLKKRLPAFTPSGVFYKRRRMENFSDYSGFIHLDFDKLNQEQLDNAKVKLEEIPATYSYFVSPSGDGLKVFVKVSTNEEEHHSTYLAVQRYYEDLLKISADSSCKDITRLCFVSYDPNIYINRDSSQFTPDINVSKETESKEFETCESKKSSNIDVVEKLANCIEYTNRKLNYRKGNRNNFIYLLALNCCQAGISLGDALSNICSKYDLETKEMEATIKSAYNRVVDKSKNDLNTSYDSINTSLIPDSVYDQLPNLLSKCSRVFQEKRERDVFLTSVLAICSGALSTVYGTYAGRTVYPNIFSFVIAPAASGKGSMNFARKFGLNYHNQVISDSKDALKEYKYSLEVYKRELKDKKKGENLEEPIKPPFKVFYIPANTSQAKILSHLQDNGGKGVICETEADSMGNALKQDWGSYSDIMRKAFHGEPISYSRKTEDEYISIDKPKLSIAISGTPGQVANLIHSAEDGLFSRFIYYTFQSEVKWKDVSPQSNRMNLDEFFDDLASVFSDFAEYAEIYPLEVTLNESQWERVNSFGANCLNEVTCFNSDQAASIAKRMVLISFKIMLQLTAFRRFEDGDTNKKLPCYECDFKIAISLTRVYLEHSLVIYNSLPKTENKTFNGNNTRKAFFDSLSDKFQRQEAISVGMSYNMSIRSIDGWLKKFVDAGILVQPGHGRYEKSSKLRE